MVNSAAASCAGPGDLRHVELTTGRGWARTSSGNAAVPTARRWQHRRMGDDGATTHESDDPSTWFHLVCPACGSTSEDDPPPSVCSTCRVDRSHQTPRASRTAQERLQQRSELSTRLDRTWTRECPP